VKIQIAKQPDGSGLLRCIRADGSATWQKQTKQAAHFALHDLTHYAVETVFGYQQGFWGLLAAGWDLEDVTGKGSRGPIPAEANEVERVVGLFDAERGSRAIWTVEEFNEFGPRSFTEAEIKAVRATRAELFRQWLQVSPGQQLELTFQPLH
jgi:hypothetical protein